MDNQLLKKRLQISEGALGNLKLEGLSPDVETIADGISWAHGVITIEEALERFRERARLIVEAQDLDTPNVGQNSHQRPFER